MKKFLFALAVVAASLFASEKVDTVNADHGVAYCGGDGQKSCLSQTSPYVKEAIIKGGEVTWCLNPRASNYPNFRTQVTQVMDDEAAKLGIPHREVAYPSNPRDISCQVRHDMPENHQCDGCAAWIYTQNYPVIVEYKWQLGYWDWKTTAGHEMGHGTCLLDEHYDKYNFVSYYKTYGKWIHGSPTVMDFGTGEWALTTYDVARCKETLAPRPIDSFYGMWWEGDRVFGYFCGTADTRATRVAIMAVAPDGTPYWSGIHMPAKDACQSFEIKPGAGWCFDINIENAISWRNFRNDTRLGCT